MENKVEKQIKLKAPISRVWQAISDYQQFGNWFCVKFDKPFVAGQPALGILTYPGYEGAEWKATIQKIEPERLFSFTWHPYAVDPKIDYSNETPTLVEFKLEEVEGGTLLTVTETGFDKLPKDRASEAFRMNDHGWSEQVKNIEKYVTQAS